MTGYFWVLVGVIVVATIKYLTSVRLRRLTDGVHREHADTSELRQDLFLVEEKGIAAEQGSRASRRECQRHAERGQ